MAQSRGQSVGDVGRFGKLSQPEFALNGPLHLLLRRPAAASDDFLDARGIVTDDRQIALPSRQENDAACMAHEDGGARMLVVSVKLLDGQDVGMKLLDHLNEPVEDGENAPGHVRGLVLVAADDAGLAQDGAKRAYFEDAVAGCVQAGIDAKDATGGCHVSVCHE